MVVVFVVIGVDFVVGLVVAFEVVDFVVCFEVDLVVVVVVEVEEV